MKSEDETVRGVQFRTTPTLDFISRSSAIPVLAYQYSFFFLRAMHTSGRINRTPRTRPAVSGILPHEHAVSGV